MVFLVVGVVVVVVAVEHGKSECCGMLFCFFRAT